MNVCEFRHAPELRRAQSVTLETMRRAADYAASTGLTVDLIAVSFMEDRSMVPTPFVSPPSLAGSVRDHVPSAPRKLPFVSEIFDAAARATSATHLVYTNIDIALVPHFYVAVAGLLSSGDPSLVINRRTIPDFANRDRLPALEVMASFVGERHPGRDCFVFPTDALDGFVLGRVVIGASGIGRALQWNLEQVCGPTTWRKDLHVTFHLGDDKAWRNPAHRPVNEFNLREIIAVYDELVERYGAFERFTQHPSEQPL